MHVSYNEYILDNFPEEGVKGSLESISFIQCHYSRKSFRALIFPTDIFTVMTEEFSRGMYTYNLDKKESTLCSFAQSRFATLWANECGKKGQKFKPKSFKYILFSCHCKTSKKIVTLSLLKWLQNKLFEMIQFKF